MDSFFYKDSEAVHLWLHIILKANFKDNNFMFNGASRTVKRGQLLTGRKALSLETGINPSKIYRLLKIFESEQLIEQQANSKFSIITVVNYDLYQQGEQQSEQPVNTNENIYKNIKKENNNINIITKEKKSGEKKNYGEYGHVKLTDEQMEKLIDKFGEKRTNEMIEKMDTYVEGTGKKYKNYYSTALNWFKKEKPVKRNLTMFDF